MSGSAKLIKRRIKSAENIGQVTKAMEMVASSKMRKAKKAVEQSKPYSQKIFEMTTSLINKSAFKLHPLLKTPKDDLKPLVILITTNRGLCGSLNLNLFRKVADFVQEKTNQSKVVFDYLTLGTKGVDFILKIGGGTLADLSDLTPFNTTIDSVCQMVSEQFIQKKNTSVCLIYNQFINALRQEPLIKRILPITDFKNPEPNLEAQNQVEYLIEPSASEIINFLLPFYLETQIREAILQAEASEYAARMLAMKNATDNASALKTGLTIKYNKARQQAITAEITDMVTAKTSMEKK